MVAVHELTEDQVARELRHVVDGLHAIVTGLRNVDLDEWDRVKSLLSDVTPLVHLLGSEVLTLETLDMDLTRKDRLFNKVTSGPGGNGYGRWDG
jgi:hypothetical protein